MVLTGAHYIYILFMLIILMNSAAAICGVSPIELAKRNFVPVITGLIVTTLVAMLIL